MKTPRHSQSSISARFGLVLAVLLAGMLAAAGSTRVGATPPIADERIESGSTPIDLSSGGASAAVSLPPNASADWWSAVQEDIRQSEYLVTWQEHTYLADVDAAYQAPNRTQNLRTYFTGEGIHVIPRAFEGETPPWRWGLTLAGYGLAGRLQAAGEPVQTVAEGNRIEYDYAFPITAWFVNAEHGLEHGFTITQPPIASLSPDGEGAAAEGEDLVLEMTFTGDLVPSLVDDRTVEFAPSSDETLRYGELLVTDAGGRRLPARFSVSSDSVAIIVADAHAAYPIILGATLTGLSTSADWTAEGNQADAQFGTSVGAAGDVNGDGYADLIVGAPWYHEVRRTRGGPTSTMARVPD